MARTAPLDRPGTIRALGVLAILLGLGAVLLTYGMFNKTFVREVPVTVLSSDVGLQLNKNADVKLRGVLVGRVQDITATGGSATIHLGIDPAQQDQIPSNVQALVVPKTLFGEKYVDLQVVSPTSSRPIRADETLIQAEVPVEVETVLNDLDPILSALNPQDLSYTLTALADAFDGQGETLGKTIDTLEDYLQKITPLADRIVEDVTELGKVAETYGKVMPDFGQTLSNAVVTGNTLTARRAQLQALFTETAAFAATADGFLQTSGDDIITLSKQAVPTLSLLGNYAPTLRCVLQGLDRLKPGIDSAFRDRRAHVSIEFAPRSSRGYDSGDAATLPPASGGSKELAPSCASLPNTPYNGSRPAPGLSKGLLAELGITGSLGKTKALPSSAAARVTTAGTPVEKEQIDAVLAPALGVDPSAVPGVAQALAGPILRGAEVSFG